MELWHNKRAGLWWGWPYIQANYCTDQSPTSKVCLEFYVGSCDHDSCRFMWSWLLSVHVIMTPVGSCDHDSCRFMWSWLLSVHVIMTPVGSCDHDSCQFMGHLRLTGDARPEGVALKAGDEGANYLCLPWAWDTLAGQMPYLWLLKIPDHRPDPPATPKAPKYPSPSPKVNPVSKLIFCPS